MKVGFFPLHTFSKPGGVKYHVLALQKEFQRRGISSKIVVPRRHDKEKYGKDIILLGNSIEIPFKGTRADFTVCLKPSEIRRLLGREKFDILHFHNFGLHSFQVLEESEATNILTFHADIPSGIIKNILLASLKKLAAPKLHGIICIAPFQLKFFKGIRCPKVVIPNGVDLKKFRPDIAPIKKYKDGKLNILFLGRVEKRKGLIYLLRAYKMLKGEFPNTRVIVVGTGPLLQECKKYVAENKLKDVVFEGDVSPQEVPAYYAMCDIFVSPAIFGESFGMVLVEAMACGKPVVAFANEGYKGVLTGKGAEFLVKPKDWRGLAKKIKVLLRDEKLRQRMGKWGIKHAESYEWSKITDRILRFYDEVRHSS